MNNKKPSSFDEKLLNLSRSIYQTSVMSHGSKMNPSDQIDAIKNMIREFIRSEVVPYELTDSEKLSFILKNESIINAAVMSGHQASDGDEFHATREKIKKYRIQLGIIDETGKLIR